MALMRELCCHPSRHVDRNVWTEKRVLNSAWYSIDKEYCVEMKYNTILGWHRQYLVVVFFIVRVWQGSYHRHTPTATAATTTSDALSRCICVRVEWSEKAFERTSTRMWSEGASRGKICWWYSFLTVHATTSLPDGNESTWPILHLPL